MTALNGGLRSPGGGFGDGGGDGIPVGGSEVAAIEREPPGTVGVDEGLGFIGGPARRWDPLSRRGWHGRRVGCAK